MTDRYALVLTSSPAAPALSRDAVGRAVSAFPDGLSPDPIWLAEGEAWQAAFITRDPSEPERVRSAVAAALTDFSIDVNVVANDAARRKKLLVADMESTIIEQECLDELADHIGLRDRKSTRLNSSHVKISYAVFCLKKKK